MKIYAAFGRVIKGDEDRALHFVEIMEDEKIDKSKLFDPLNRASVVREAYFNSVNRDNRGILRQIDLDKPMMISIIDRALKGGYTLEDISLFKADFFGQSIEDPKIDLEDIITSINKKFSVQEIYDKVCRDGEIIEIYSIKLRKDNTTITIYLNGLLKIRDPKEEILYEIEDIVEQVFIQKREYMKELFR